MALCPTGPPLGKNPGSAPATTSIQNMCPYLSIRDVSTTSIQNMCPYICLSGMYPPYPFRTCSPISVYPGCIQHIHSEHVPLSVYLVCIHHTIQNMFPYICLSGMYPPYPFRTCAPISVYLVCIHHIHSEHVPLYLSIRDVSITSIQNMCPYICLSGMYPPHPFRTCASISVYPGCIHHIHSEHVPLYLSIWYVSTTSIQNMCLYICLSGMYPPHPFRTCAPICLSGMYPPHPFRTCAPICLFGMYPPHPFRTCAPICLSGMYPSHPFRTCAPLSVYPGCIHHVPLYLSIRDVSTMCPYICLSGMYPPHPFRTNISYGFFKRWKKL